MYHYYMENILFHISNKTLNSWLKKFDTISNSYDSINK